MKNDDQWFEPGDKVMRVAHGAPNTIPFKPNLAPYGAVFCVESCFHNPKYNRNSVTFIGVVNTRQAKGFVAANFRKVEEIQLCVRAAEAMKTPKKQEELA